MSEPNNEGAENTPAPSNDPAPEPQPHEPAPPAKPSDSSGLTLTSDQLKARLDRAKESAGKEATDALLKQLGVSSLDDVKAAVEAKRQQEEAQKSLEERLASEQAEREKQSQELQRYRETVSLRAQHELDSLTDEQRDAVKAIAGDDAAQQLATITALRPTWAAKSSAESEQDKPQPKPVASTAPPRNQPGDGDTSKPDHLAEYERLRSNPETRAAALVYMNRYSREIFAAKRSRAS